MKTSFFLIAAFLCAFTLPMQAETSLQPLNEPPQEPIAQSLQSHFIWVPEGTQLKSVVVAFRKTFALQSTPTQGQLSIFADRRYMLWLNGHYVERGPVRFVPIGPEYDSVDVTRFLKTGDNQITVLVLGAGTGGKMMNHAPGLTLQLDLKTDHGVDQWVTDATWKWSDRTRYLTPEVSWSGVKDKMDATVEDGEWMEPGYDDGKWALAAPVSGSKWGPLSLSRIPLRQDTPLNPTFDANATFPLPLNPGQQVSFSLPHLVQAYTILDITAEAGSVLELTYAGISYKAKAGHQVYFTSDTHGFNQGAFKVVSGHITINSVQLVEWIYPFTIEGSFSSSDPLLDKLWALCTRSDQVLSEDAYDDCADRERVEWMDCDPPGFDITRIAFAGPGENGTKLYADPRLLKEMVRRTAGTLQPEGWVKAHTCSDRFDIHAKMEDRACDWVEGARRYYESCGDLNLIREIWPALHAQMQYFLDRRTSRGLLLAREWVVWGNPMSYKTLEGAGMNAFFYKALVDAAYLGNLIEQKQDAGLYTKAAADLKAAYNKVLWNEKDGTYYGGYYDADSLARDKNAPKELIPTEGGFYTDGKWFPALFALDQGIVPPDRQDRVTKYLLAQRNTGRVMFYYYLFKQYYAQNDPALDQKVLDILRKEWKGMVESKAQVSWEEFGGGSHAHIYGCFPGWFLSSNVLGVRWKDGVPLHKQLLLEPHLGDLTEAHGTVVTESGPVPVAWKKQARTLTFTFTAPTGVTTTLHLPKSGETAELELDGQPVSASQVKPIPGYWELTVPAGTHEGTLHLP